MAEHAARSPARRPACSPARSTEARMPRRGRSAAGGAVAAPAPAPFKFGRWFRATGWRHVVGIVMVAFALFPIVFVISSSLNPQGTLTGSNALFSAIGLDSYVRILTDPQVPYPQWFANTLLIAVDHGGRHGVPRRRSPPTAFSRMRFTGRRFGLISIVVVQMFPQLLAVVAIFLLMSAIARLVPGDRPQHAHRPDHGLPRRRARREHLPHVRLLQHDPRVDRRGREDRRRRPRPHLLHDHPAARRADPRGRRRCCRSSSR